jgi:hypothetical protein
MHFLWTVVDMVLFQKQIYCYSLVTYYYYYYCFKFILYYYLLGGDLQVSPDLKKKSKRFTPALYELCLQCSLVWSTVALWPMGDLWATEGSYPIPSYLFLMLQLNWHNFCSHFPIMMTSISRSFNWLSFSVSFVLMFESSSMAISISRHVFSFSTCSLYYYYLK